MRLSCGVCNRPLNCILLRGVFTVAGVPYPVVRSFSRHIFMQIYYGTEYVPVLSDTYFNIFCHCARVTKYSNDTNAIYQEFTDMYIKD